jgi:hypothetical protein
LKYHSLFFVGMSITLMREKEKFGRYVQGRTQLTRPWRKRKGDFRREKVEERKNLSSLTVHSWFCKIREIRTTFNLEWKINSRDHKKGVEGFLWIGF